MNKQELIEKWTGKCEEALKSGYIWTALGINELKEALEEAFELGQNSVTEVVTKIFTEKDIEEIRQQEQERIMKIINNLTDRCRDVENEQGINVLRELKKRFKL